MDLGMRLQKIAEMEGVPLTKFDVAGAQAFLDEHQRFERTYLGIDLEYEGDRLLFVTVGLSYKDPVRKIEGMVPEVSLSHEVYSRGSD